MKRILSAGEGYALFPTNINYRMPRNFPGLRASILYTIGLFMCLQANMAKGTTPATEVGRAVFYANDSIRPLQIGDTIPEALWDMPLQVVNHPEGREVITLGEYRGQVILLDFLSTGCSSCIQALPKLEKLRMEADGGLHILAITPQKREDVRGFIPKNQYTKSTTLPFVVEDAMLKQHFPHRYISHVVWIDAEGIVRATTGTSHVTSRTITELQQGEPLDWPVKTETASFFNAPLVSFLPASSTIPQNVERSLYYVAITGFTAGAGPYVATGQDTLMGIERVSFRNRSVIDLYRLAMEERFGNNQIVWDTPDSTAYLYTEQHAGDLTWDEWHRIHARCYERTFPLGMARKARQQLMLRDLNDFFELYGRMETIDGERFFVLSDR